MQSVLLGDTCWCVIKSDIYTQMIQKTHIYIFMYVHTQTEMGNVSREEEKQIWQNVNHWI